MKILLVEDDQFKARRLEQALRLAVPNSNFVIAKSVTSAIHNLELYRDFDLVVLDMSLPTFDVGPGESGGRPAGFGGREVMRFMVNNELTVPVVVVTQFPGFEEAQRKIDLPTLSAKLEAEFRLIFRGVVYYDAASDKWRDDLLHSINEIAKGIQAGLQ